MQTNPLPRIVRTLRFAAWIVAGAGWVASSAIAADDLTGEAIYKQKCAMCHGASGEGVPDEYPKPLIGDKSVAQLSRLIAKTMPADEPGTCLGPDADKVAAYIYDAFYSRTAQARNAPPRIELSRLTVRQYRNAVADLIGTFRSPGERSEKQGLKAEYYKGRRFRGGDRVIERIDPQVRFDFGTGSPEAGKIEPHEFSIRWEGSILAPESGVYEFIVRTEHALRLWVNDPNKPLIDAFVKSGNDSEFRASLHLLAGRSYPIRLEFSKAKQGVDDSKTNKKPPPLVKASIALEWKPPQQVEELIPARYLSPTRSPETFVVTAAFPPDDRSIGYERGTSVSKAWDEATTEGAIEVTGYVSTKLRELAGVRDDSADRAEKHREFCRKFAERAFRRPLSDLERKLYIDGQFADMADPNLAVKRVILLVMKSPRFLYRDLGGAKPDAYDVASRLSFGLWDSLPDQELLKAAADGRLATREQVAHQAERMLPDLRTQSKLREFFFQWLKCDPVPDLSKDRKAFADFDPAMASDLRTSLDLFIDEVVRSETSDFRQLLLSDALYLNGRLARYYGVPLTTDAPFRRTVDESKERAGVLTHPYLMASLGYTSTSSPIHRGVFIARSLLGKTLRPPPEAFAPLAPDLHPKLTTRERVALQTSPQACATCHGLINPLGFTLERFDTVGRYRGEEKDRPIDANGSYLTRSGETVTFSGARDLAAYLANSEETHEAFVEQLFHTLVKQPVRAYGPDKLGELRRSFTDQQFHIRKLVVQILADTALTPAR